MEVNTALTNEIERTDNEKMYDENCKNLLSNKMILAWIMKECIKEFEDIDATDIADFYIEGQPDIGNRKVISGEKIRGLPTEVINDNDKKIFYDIRYQATVPKAQEKTTELIINIEAQNQYYTGYPLIKRGVFYASQMLVNQYGTEFSKSEYDKLKKVYSVWICHSVPKRLANTITSYKMSECNIVGVRTEDKENYDLISIVMIYLGDETDKVSSPILKLLNRLLSEKLSAEEKLEMLETEYKISRTEKIEEELTHMCNLSQGVLQRGREQRNIEIAQNGLRNNVPLDTISIMTGLTISELTDMTIEKTTKIDTK